MNRLAIIYVALLHATLAWVLWNSDFIDRVSRNFGAAAVKSNSAKPLKAKLTESVKPEFTAYYRRILRYHTRSVDVVPDRSVIFVGDSITQGLAVAAVHPLSINYGIGSDTTKGVIYRLPTYMSALERAECIVLAIGINDIRYRNADGAIQNYVQILDALPDDVRVVVSAILPIDVDARSELADRKDWIERFNSELRRLASEREMVMFVDSSKGLDVDLDGRLDESLHDGDGVHLNSAGNTVWASNLREAIQSHQKPKIGDR
jgi:lysophospholipase L1-like esterase